MFMYATTKAAAGVVRVAGLQYSVVKAQLTWLGIIHAIHRYLAER